jgi:hypothetical protein
MALSPFLTAIGHAGVIVKNFLLLTDSWRSGPQLAVKLARMPETATIVKPVPSTRGNFMKKTYRLLLASIAALAVSTGANAAFSSWTFTGLSSGGLPVNVTATFTTGAGTLTIDIFNNQSNLTASNQAVSGVTFAFVPAVALASLSVTSQTAPNGLVNYNAGGGGASLVGGPQPVVGWGVTGSTTLWTLTGGQPDYLITGPGPYTNANGGMSNFNPYINQQGRFVLTSSQITAQTVVAGVNFLFGTGPDSSGGGSCTGDCGDIRTPEPQSLALIAVGLLALMAFARRARA